jgi:tetratricopeptide (TPR) repeat protein
MGIFDFFKSTKTDKAEKASRTELINSYEDLKRETDKLREENAAWEKEFNHIIKLREKATALDKSGKYSEAIEIFKESVSFGENSERLNISNYAHDIERIIILLGKDKQVEKQKLFLETVIKNYPDYSDIDKWKVRLSKLTAKSSSDNQTKITPSDIISPTPNNPTLGKKYQNFKDSLPEFNFYYDMPDGMQTFEYLRIYNPVPFEKSKKLREFRETFNSILSEAKIAENKEDYKKAIEIYLKLIAEEYDGKEPFERLIIIYNKLKWKEQTLEIIKKAIKHFEELKESQKNKIIAVSRKYGMENKAMEYINADKKIQYYGGAFDLYNPYPIIDKWKQKLEKIK